MNLAHAIPEKELLLAQLAASKLAQVMHGLMSVGTGAMEMSTASDFLTGRDKAPLGFLEVLRCLGVRPSYADKVPLLRQQVDELADLTSRFHATFLELAHWRTMSPQNVRATVNRLGDTYATFCQLLGAFCAGLGVDADYTNQAQQDRLMLAALFQNQERA